MVTADDIGVEENQLVKSYVGNSRTLANESTLRTQPRKEIESQDYRRSNGDRRSAKVSREKKDRNRVGSAPAKRVVSDGHWRKERRPPKSKISSQVTEDSRFESEQPRDSIQAMPSPESKSAERGRREMDRSKPKKESSDCDDGIRVYVTPPGTTRRSGHPLRRQSNHAASANEAVSDVVLAEASPSSGSTKARRPSTRETSSPFASSAHEGDPRRRRSSDQKTVVLDELPRSAKEALSDGRGSIKLCKGNILSQVFGDSRKVFAKQMPEPITTPRVPSIEAWLNETPNPFVDADETPIDIILPLKLIPGGKKEIAQRQDIVADPNEIWESLDTKEGTRRAVNRSKRRKRIPSSSIYMDNPFPANFESDSAPSALGKGTSSTPKFIDLVQERPETSTPSLKRRSARKSVTLPLCDGQKSCLSKESSKENDTESIVSSSHTVYSNEGPNSREKLKPPGLNVKRPFPSTGKHRLSTIASVETFSTGQTAAPPSLSEISERTLLPTPIAEEEVASEARDHFDPNSLKRNNSRLTKHADLISVLSLPRAGRRSIQSARSIRTNRSSLATATIGDLMQELATDEGKYMRELRTLVDGVIPVLLTCVLSKSDSAVAAGLFQASSSGHDDPNFTRPIVEMGIALERMKTLHRRIPQDNAAALLIWAHGAQKVYAEYLKAWRMGFQDVVVNLAPAAENSSMLSGSQSERSQDLDEGLPQNEEGDIVNGDGERVDVAFLLKRPLVRLKYLAKTLKGINFIKPSTEAETLTVKFQKLVDDARQRLNEERARLEDEAASNIDPTRARDPRTLGPLTGVSVDKTRRVRARDLFNLALQHSSGQRVDCRVELLLRDEASDVGSGGDLLICEVDGTGRWLLFPPVQLGHVSARNGDHKGEIVVMVRGASGDGSEWQELFSLLSEDEQAGFEWVHMIGLTPVPPKLMRTQSFTSRPHKTELLFESNLPRLEALPTFGTAPKSRLPSPREVDVPIGEQPNDVSKSWVEPLVSRPSRSPGSTLRPASRWTARSQNLSKDELPSTASKSPNNYVDQVNELRSLPSQSQNCETIPSESTRRPRSFKEALGLSGTSTSVGLKRARAKKLSRRREGSPSSRKSADEIQLDDGSPTPSPDEASPRKPVEGSPNDRNNLRSLLPEPGEEHPRSNPKPSTEQHDGKLRPYYQRAQSSVPSRELPYIPKSRTNSRSITPIAEPEEEPQWPKLADSDELRSGSKQSKKRSSSSRAEALQVGSPQETPIHLPSISIPQGGTKAPIFGYSQVKPRRSSSPLKHEYEPSTASESSSDSDTSTVERNEATSVSDSSENEDLEEGDAPTPLLPLGHLKLLHNVRIPISTPHSTPDGTIKPSESASQAPYKMVPSQPTKASKAIASIFSWSDTGTWQSLHPEECSIVITPGLIEAYEMSAAHSQNLPLCSPIPVVDADTYSDLASNTNSQNDEAQGDRPLVGLELTPLVPLRRGTALDISIRSPPTPNSQINSGNNILFRSRNPEECEALYALINHSRIHNPTFIALQNARGPYSSGNSLSDRRASASGSVSRSSWFGGWGRSSSYRASSAPTPSIAPSDSSIGSMSSAFSALKRFGRGGGMFNISRSTITSREGSRANSIYTSSDNSSGSGTSSPAPIPGMTGAGKEAPIGLSNAKIRLYIRETASRWRDLGSARLTIMRPEKFDVGSDGRPPSSSMHQHVCGEKRIVINGKTKGEVLLDVQLGESCFERVARTGIALSVWEDVVGPNGEVGVVGAVGGVGGGRAKVYMIQVGNSDSSQEIASGFGIKRLTISTDGERSGDCLYIFDRWEVTVLSPRLIMAIYSIVSNPQRSRRNFVPDCFACPKAFRELSTSFTMTLLLYTHISRALRYGLVFCVYTLRVLDDSIAQYDIIGEMRLEITFCEQRPSIRSIIIKSHHALR